MKLYNCCTEEEKELKAIDLNVLTKEQKKKLAKDIITKAEEGILEDELIVIDALYQIIESM